nr:dihydroorotase [Cyanobium sp. PCC 7001]
MQRVQLLQGPGSLPDPQDALIAADGVLEAIGPEAAERGAALALRPIPASGWILAPVLVDAHSVLEDPWTGRAETLSSLAQAAAAGGYGTVALLPWARPWRDRPERLGLQWPDPLQLLLWGSFSRDGADGDLAPHADQVAAGAIGLACGAECPPLPLLERGLLLAEAGNRPVLVAPRQAALTSGGFVREGVEALRAGWPPDPLASEVLPLTALLSLACRSGGDSLILMNLSTAAGVEALNRSPQCPPVTVSWWHLVADSSSLTPTEEGWRVEPSLGTPEDRQALQDALAGGLIQAVAVHHQPVDAEERLLPLDQRRPGVAGHGASHGLVLPALWRELVQRRGWTPQALWQVLSWGPSALLRQPPEQLRAGSRRWLLFDPEASSGGPSASLAANLPLHALPPQGRVRATGLTAAACWQLDPSSAQEPGSPPA